MNLEIKCVILHQLCNCVDTYVSLLPLAKQSLGQGNVFTPVCQSFYSQRGCLWLGSVHPLSIHTQTPTPPGHPTGHTYFPLYTPSPDKHP